LDRRTRQTEADANANLLTQIPESGAGIKVLGKFLFIGRQARANQISVRERKAKLLHFFFWLSPRTSPLRTYGTTQSSLRCGCHPDGNEQNFFPGILPQQHKEFREYFIFWKRTLPR
jgi:hypothetical protein